MPGEVQTLVPVTTREARQVCRKTISTSLLTLFTLTGGPNVVITGDHS